MPPVPGTAHLLAGPAGRGQQPLAALAGHDPPKVAIPGESHRGQVERRQRAPGWEGTEDGLERLGVPPGAGQLAHAVHRGGEGRGVIEVGGQPAIALALAGQLEAAEAAFAPYASLLRLLGQGNGIGFYLTKEVLRLRGVFTCTDVRRPAVKPDDLSYREIRAQIEALGLDRLPTPSASA